MTKSKHFRYKAIDRRGQIVKGDIQASNPALAKVSLTKQGLSDIRLSVASKPLLPRSTKVHSKELLIVLRTLATLVQAGIMLDKALSIIAQNTHHRHLKQVITQIRQDIESGLSFAHAIKKHQHIFGRLTIALIDAGEQSGTLDMMLIQLANHHENQVKLKQNLHQALRYPVAVVAVALIVMTVLLLKVVPSFAKTFESMGSQLPLLTQLVLQLSEILRTYFWYGFIMLAVVSAFIGWRYRRRQSTRLYLIKHIMRIPVIGQLLKDSANARFASTLAITFGAGVALPHAIQLASHATNDELFIEQMHTLKSQVQTGSTLTNAAKQSGLFTPISIQLMMVGEESGQLTQMLDKIALYHQDAVQQTTKTLLNMLEPIIMIMLGILVGTLVLAMYLPIFYLGIGS